MSTGQKYPFTFDKVFNHEASQQDVFVEISQLVQSALDGYKVILFFFTEQIRDVLVASVIFFSDLKAKNWDYDAP